MIHNKQIKRDWEREGIDVTLILFLTHPGRLPLTVSYFVILCSHLQGRFHVLFTQKEFIIVLEVVEML